MRQTRAISAAAQRAQIEQLQEDEEDDEEEQEEQENQGQDVDSNEDIFSGLINQHGSNGELHLCGLRSVIIRDTFHLNFVGEIVSCFNFRSKDSYLCNKVDSASDF